LSSEHILMGKKKTMLPHSASIYFNALVVSMLDSYTVYSSFIEILE